jgi:hypothetical protein
MKSKLLNFLLIVTSLIGYLEWGENNHSFLFQAEAEIVSNLFKDPVASVHPFTVLPLLGQILLLITLFQPIPNRVLTYTGIAGLSLLLLFMFVIGAISMNFKILGSTIPFLTVAILAIQYNRPNR